jgi:hypothetical protein
MVSRWISNASGGQAILWRGRSQNLLAIVSVFEGCGDLAEGEGESSDYGAGSFEEASLTQGAVRRVGCRVFVRYLHI